MKTEQKIWTEEAGWEELSSQALGESAQLVLVFGERALLSQRGHFAEIRQAYPQARILMATTAGEICDAKVYERSIVLTAIELESTEIQLAKLSLNRAKDSEQAGILLMDELQGDQLTHLFLLCDGHKVNGSALVKSLNQALPQGVFVTGGLAGDGSQAQSTLVGLDEPPSEGTIVAVGFYGRRLRVGFGAGGGWDTVGPLRRITSAKGNVIYELDGQNALDLYKKFLVKQSCDLSVAPFLFPLALKLERDDPPLVRTPLLANSTPSGMTLAGDTPEGAYVQFMRASVDRLLQGASQAARKSQEVSGKVVPELSILISCVGRKRLLGPRVEEEIESVRDILGSSAACVGFYSYGEIAPLTPWAKCALHNQTMTITTLREI